MQVSLSGPKNQSTHGRMLITELRDTSSARLETVLEYLQKDPLSGRLKETESGNNAFHYVLLGNYPHEFTMKVLKALIGTCPEGAKGTNRNGSLPLHIALSANRLDQEVIEALLATYPTAAGVADNQGLIPLFLCCMREDATGDICKALCKAFPNGPSTKNKTGSYPLHFAAKRRTPNLDILRILIRRFPQAASAVNDFGLLPLHCLCALSDSVQAVELLHSADPEAIKVPDRQGRTCLHLAVLHSGREHSTAVLLEEEEMRLQAQLATSATAMGTGAAEGGGGPCEDGGDWSDDEVPSAGNSPHQRGELSEYNSSGRRVVRFLITAYPQALCTLSNFRATPVDTVLDKVKPQKSKNKVVSVYGLYHDPPTARLLLLAQRNRSRPYCNSGTNSSSAGIVLPGLLTRQMTALREFNWQARREALYVSLLGEPRYCSCQQRGAGTAGSGGGGTSGTVEYVLRLDTTQQDGSAVGGRRSAGTGGDSSSGGGGSGSRTGKGKGPANKKSTSGTSERKGDGASALTTVFGSLSLSAAAEPALSVGLRGNLLAQLHRRGLADVVRNVIAFI